MIRKSFLGFMIAATLFAASPATAENQCGGTADFYAGLISNWGERQVWIGQSATGLLTELWMNPETGTWTLLYSSQGRSCVIAHGAGVVPPGEAL